MLNRFFLSFSIFSFLVNTLINRGCTETMLMLKMMGDMLGAQPVSFMILCLLVKNNHYFVNVFSKILEGTLIV